MCCFGKNKLLRNFIVITVDQPLAGSRAEKNSTMATKRDSEQ